MVHKPPIVDDDQSQAVELIHQKSPSSIYSNNTAADLLGIHIEEEETESRDMPPAPFVHNFGPTSPSLGEEAGMEALWVEELVTPSSVGDNHEESMMVNQEQALPRKSSFFQKRMSHGGLLWKRHNQKSKESDRDADIETSTEAVAGKSSRKKKVQTSVKLLGDEDNGQPQLQTPPKQYHHHYHQDRASSGKEDVVAAVHMEQRQSSFGESEAKNQQQQRESDLGAVKTSGSMNPDKNNLVFNHSMESEASKQISVKSAKARELLAAALHEDTDVSQREGLAQQAFAEATSARLLLEGPNAPKGLDLVLRAASHKGRSAALAAGFCPENKEQLSRAQHYMDLILPLKNFPPASCVAPAANCECPAVPAESGCTTEDSGDVSTLGFDNTWTQDSPPQRTTATGGTASRVMSPLSMSSLNEILDGPMEEEDEEAAKDETVEHLASTAPPTKIRLPFFKKRHSPQKEDPPPMEEGPAVGEEEDDEDLSDERAPPAEVMHEEKEMPPPPDAPSMDDNASWTDASLDEDGGFESRAMSASPEKPKKKKRVFRLARLAGLGGGSAAAGAGVAATSSSASSTRPEKRRWLRRNKAKSKNVLPDTPVVDCVPSPPPNVPYQSKPYQRYVANVQVDTGSRRSGPSKEVSMRALQVRDIDAITQERLEAALLADETEHLTSYDGVKMFGQNIKTEEEVAAEAEARAMEQPDEISPCDTGLSKRSIKIDPQFVNAPAGDAAILTAKSWDSLLENDAARLEDRPRAVVDAHMMQDMDYDDDEEIPPPPPPGDHYNRSVTALRTDPPESYVGSPHSTYSGTPGLTDKYSSAEEIEDKYSMEQEEKEMVGDRCLIISGADSFEAQATNENEETPMMGNIESMLEEDNESEVPMDTPRRRSLALGLLGRMQSRRRSQIQASASAPIIEEDEDDLVQEIQEQTPRSESRKPRRKLKILKSFQALKRNGKEQQPVVEDDHDDDDEERIDDHEIVGMEALKPRYDDLVLQGTSTLTDFDNSHTEEIEIEDEPDEIVAAPSEDTTDSLIRNIRKQASRIRRGRDPVTNNAVDVPRGVDP